MSLTRNALMLTAKKAAGRLSHSLDVSQIVPRWYSASVGSFSQCKQHLVVALGGNALLQRGEPMTIANQRKNISDGLSSLERVLKENTITFVHGNGPQVGLLALEGALYHKETGAEEIQLDVLDAETEGMIGYLIEQELHSRVGPENKRGIVTVLSQIIVDPEDAAFLKPTKFIGPVYTEKEVEPMQLQHEGEYFRRDDEYYKKDGEYFRRVVPSPLPVRLVDHEMRAVRLLTDNDCIVICGGGGGIPVVEDLETKKLKGVEAVIDKDRAATMLGITLNANGLMILTDVPGVAIGYGTPEEKWVKTISPQQLGKLNTHFPAGSMGPKVESAIDFVTKSGGWSSIGSLKEADKMMLREAGTLVTTEYGPDHVEFYGEREPTDLKFG